MRSATLPALTLLVATSCGGEPDAREPAPPPDSELVAPAASAEACRLDATVGWRACRECHIPESQSWSSSSLAKSLDALRPTPPSDRVRFDRKLRARLDPDRDYTTDPACLTCHTTGYGAEGGYPATAAARQAAPELAHQMGCVSCEMCHVPRGRFAPAAAATGIEEKDAASPPGNAAPVRAERPGPEVCVRCHNERSPTHQDSAFRYDLAKDRVHPGRP